MTKQEETITDLFSDSVFNVDSINNKSSFSHIPMDAAINRVDNGSGLMAEISKIFQARLDVEDKEIGFSIRVSRPNLYELEIPSSTAEKALGYLKNYYLYVSREQASYRRNLDEDLLSELEENRLKRLNKVTEHKNNISESTEAAAEASANLIRAKDTYMKVLGEVEIVRQKLSAAVSTLHALKNMTEAQRKKKKEEENKYSMGRLFSAFDRTPEEECKHQSKKLRKLEMLASEKRQDIEAKKMILLEMIQRKESFYAQAAVAFEKAESDRLFYTQRALRHYCTIEKQALEARLRLLTSFEEGAISQLNAEADIELFASKARDVDNTRMYSHALKLMEWDFKTRVETEDKPASDLDGSLSPGRLGGLVPGAGGEAGDVTGSRRDSVWADVEGDKSNKQTEMRSLHHDPERNVLVEHAPRKDTESGGEVTDHQAVEDEVTRILDEHYEGKNSLEYLFSKLKTKVVAERTVGEKKENMEQAQEEEGAAAVGMRDTGGSDTTEANDNGSTKAITNGDQNDDNHTDNNRIGDSDDEEEDDDAAAETNNLSSEETRVLLTISVLNETIFASSATAVASDTDTITSKAKKEGQKEDRNSVATGKWRVHCLSVVGFSTESGRNAFLQILDDKRGRFATLDALSFEYMTVAMKIFLDKCISPRRVMCALRLANMSITFHKLLLTSDDSTTPSATGNGASNTPAIPSKHYIQREAEINQHELWHTAGFWEDALSHGLRQQMVMMDPVQWDELEPEALNEKVMAIHNILFGQLGTLAFTMHEMGLKKPYVQKLVMNLGKSSQLGDDLQIELFKSINMSFKDETENSDLKKSKVNATAASRILSSSQDTANPLPVTATSSGSVDSQKPQAVVHATTTVLNEYIQDHPHMHPMLGKSKGQDVKGLL